jgi:hypothetical protein
MLTPPCRGSACAACGIPILQGAPSLPSPELEPLRLHGFPGRLCSNCYAEESFRALLPHRVAQSPSSSGPGRLPQEVALCSALRRVPVSLPS